MENLAKPADQYTHCPFCQSCNLVRITQPEERTNHYGRLKCGTCHKHIQWLKDPSVTLQWQQRATAIDTIIRDHSGKISSWEFQFLQNVRECRKLSDKQRDKLNAIGLKTINQRICNVDDAPPAPTPSKNPNAGLRF